MENQTTVDRIRTLANSQGLSLPALEVKLSLGNGTISRWRSSSPNSDKLIRVADYFHVSLDYLLGRHTEKIPTEPKLSEDELSIIDLYRQIPAQRRAMVLQMIRVALGQPE